VFGYSLLSSRGTALAAQLAGITSAASASSAIGPGRSVRRAYQLAAATGMGGRRALFQTGDDLQFVQLRRCLHGQGVDMAHILYRRRGRLLSLFVMPEHEPDQQELVVKGQRTVIWSQGGRTYAVVGANSSAELEELADRFFSRALP